MTDSIFTKIINGELPSYKIYEDKLTIAFLDIFPKTDGETLVVPKVQIASLWDLPDEYYQAVMETSRKIAKHLKRTLGTEYVGVEVVGVDVPHAHVHIIPFNTPQEFLRVPNKTGEPDHKRLQPLAIKLRLDVQ